jgi:hypothetical protein
VKAWSTHNRHLSIYLYLQTPQTPLGIYDLKYHHLSSSIRLWLCLSEPDPEQRLQPVCQSSVRFNKLESYWYVGSSICFFSVGRVDRACSATTRTEASVRSVWTAPIGWVDRIFLDWPPSFENTKSRIGGKMGWYDRQTGWSLCSDWVWTNKVTA